MKKKLIIILLLMIGISGSYSQNNKKQFTESFRQENYTFSSSGKNEYFILEPGYQIILEGTEDKELVQLIITVLNETKKVGNIETRIVEEKESANGKLKEVSKNYFALCRETGSIFYFGEDVDMYNDGKIINHEGSWLAEGKNKAGLVIPGICLLGSRYYQEMAPDLAMDRAEIISISEVFKTAAGNFTNCLKTEETTPLNPKEKSFKIYAPGVGLIKDGNLLVVKYGFVK